MSWIEKAQGGEGVLTAHCDMLYERCTPCDLCLIALVIQPTYSRLCLLPETPVKRALKMFTQRPFCHWNIKPHGCILFKSRVTKYGSTRNFNHINSFLTMPNYSVSHNFCLRVTGSHRMSVRPCLLLIYCKMF